MPLPLVSNDARFSDSFDSLDLRLSRRFAVTSLVQPGGDRRVLQRLQRDEHPRRVASSNYSGFANVLARDSSDPADPGFLRSSSFGRALTTAGGVFGSGGPRAFQLGLRAQF